MVAANVPSPPPAGSESSPTVPKPAGLRTTEPLLAIPVAMIATIAAWIAIDRSFGAIPHPPMTEEYLKEAAAKYTALHTLSPHLLEEGEVKRQIFIYRNTGFALGLAGGVFGLCFGLLAGAERNRMFRAPIGACVGVLAGVLFGAAAGYAGAAVSEYAEHHKFEPRSAAEMQQVWLREMYTSISIHAAEWCTIGIGLALVFSRFGHPTRSLGRTLVTALVAGFLAAAAFTPLAAMMFPDAKSNITVPEGLWNRLLFVILPATTFAFLLVLQRSRPAGVATVPAGGEKVPGSVVPSEGSPPADAATRARRFGAARESRNQP